MYQPARGLRFCLYLQMHCSCIRKKRLRKLLQKLKSWKRTLVQNGTYCRKRRNTTVKSSGRRQENTDKEEREDKEDKWELKVQEWYERCCNNRPQYFWKLSCGKFPGSGSPETIGSINERSFLCEIIMMRDYFDVRSFTMGDHVDSRLLQEDHTIKTSLFEAIYL